jgi:hypothetical protein
LPLLSFFVLLYFLPLLSFFFLPPFSFPLAYFTFSTDFLLAFSVVLGLSDFDLGDLGGDFYD